ncbi:MAG: transcriptional repressor [Endozoicomonadaceae bacterium]|nr:transcriptional repressor [Endozoicomonadaceae bacterium]
MLLKTLGHNVAPSTVYRAVGFLQAHDLVHCIDSMSTQIDYPHLEQPNESSFLIDKQCHATVELDNRIITEAIAQLADCGDFLINYPSVERTGLCPSCRKPN